MRVDDERDNAFLVVCDRGGVSVGEKIRVRVQVRLAEQNLKGRLRLNFLLFFSLLSPTGLW